ncbi:hypothetical protein QTN25_005069 [Entamoeba marina]
MIQFEENLQNKLLISFNDRIWNQTKKLYLQSIQQDTIYNINSNHNIEFIQFTLSTIPNSTEIQLINQINKYVTIELVISTDSVEQLISLHNKVNNNVSITVNGIDTRCVVISDSCYEYCLNPFNNNLTKILYENDYIPNVLTINNLNEELNDFSMFKYVQKVIMSNYVNVHQKQVKLPITISSFVFDYPYYNSLHTFSITNWKDLNNLKHIKAHENLDIPYPHIIYEEIYNSLQKPTYSELIHGWVNVLCCVHLILSLFVAITSLILNFMFLDTFPTWTYTCIIYYLWLYAIETIIGGLETLVRYINDLEDINWLLSIGYGFSIIIYAYSLLYYTSPFIVYSLGIISVTLLLFYHFLTWCLCGRLSKHRQLRTLSIITCGLFGNKLLTQFIDIIDRFEIIFILLGVFGFGLLHIVGLITSFFCTTSFISYLCPIALLWIFILCWCWKSGEY